MPKKLSRGDESQASEQTVQLDLEGFTPSESDRDGISVLLKHLFVKESSVNTKLLADYIIKNNTVGTVVKPAEPDDDDEDDDEDERQIVLALTSVVDISEEAAEKNAVLKSVRTFILGLVNRAHDSDAKANILMILSDSNLKTCLLINERFENLPLTICADAVAALPSELKESHISPTHLVIIYRGFNSEAAKGDIEYAHPEAEHIKPFSLYTVDVQAQSSEEDAECDYNTYTLMIILMEKFNDVLEALRSHV